MLQSLTLLSLSLSNVMQGEEDFGDLRVEVVRGVRSSQATSCLRLVDIVSPKLKAAQALL